MSFHCLMHLEENPKPLSSHTKPSMVWPQPVTGLVSYTVLLLRELYSFPLYQICPYRSLCQECSDPGSSSDLFSSHFSLILNTASSVRCFPSEPIQCYPLLPPPPQSLPLTAPRLPSILDLATPRN